MAESVLHDRLTRAAGDRTYRALAELTRTNAETCRRYMQGQSPSAEFLAAFCAALGINGDWLLTGQGPMRVSDARAHALRQADPGELLAAMANTLDTLSGRLDRLEVFVQTLETRLRVAHTPGDARRGAGDPERSSPEEGEPVDDRDGADSVGTDGTSSVRRVADVVARRSSPPAP